MKRNTVLGLMAALVLGMAYGIGGCKTWDTIVENGGEIIGSISNYPPIVPPVTNVPPVIAPVETNAPAITNTSNEAACGCDLSKPLVDPPLPYTGEWLKKRNELSKKTRNQGNSEECPVYDGYDVRYAVIRPSVPGASWLIASPFKNQMIYGKNTMTLRCVEKNGCRWHVKAWAKGRPALGSEEWKSGNTAPLQRTGIFFLIEVRNIK